jgi:hypothetical protein
VTIAAALAAAATFAHAVAGGGDAARPARLDGTYLQLIAAHARWSARDWERLFASFRALGLTRLVVQWTAYDDRAFYGPAGEHSAMSPVERIMRLADVARMHVLVGLVQDPRYWDAIRAQPSTVREYLSALRARERAVASALAPALLTHPSFGGFYITEEIDDGLWTEPARREIVVAHVSQLATALHAIVPDRSVAISGFSTRGSDPQALEAFWSALLAAAPVDVVIFQDGVGARNLDVDRVPRYLDAIAHAVTERNRRLEVVVEIFTEVDSGRDIRAFRAVPAPLSRIVRQIEVAGRAGVPLIAFSVPEYMSPLGGRKAHDLYERYRGWLARRATAADAR